MHAGPRWVIGHHRIFAFSVGKSGENLKKEVKKSEKIAENSIGLCRLNLHSSPDGNASDVLRDESPKKGETQQKLS